MKPVRGYRYIRFGRRRAPWRETADEALIDALDDGQATEAWYPPHRISVTWPGAIERTTAAVETVPRPLIRTRRHLEEAA